MSSSDGCLPLSRVQQRQKFGWQAPKANTVPRSEFGKLDGGGKLNLMASSLKAPSKRDIGLNVATRAERMDRDPHGARIE
ncbi:hypothetical protein GCM10007908_20260 [Rhizobium albus]|nr:hypothetical protein GCM10007908_20260 [Rhizobium albus]